MTIAEPRQSAEIQEQSTSGLIADSANGGTSICIIGNSNSIGHKSFVSRLIGRPDFQVTNLSIGGTPNVVLLNVLASGEIFAADFIIVETCVVDADFGATGRYARQRSLETLELFITEIRTRCKAQIIFLAIPTRLALMSPHKHWAESVYRGAAMRFGVPILNGYALLRTLIGLPESRRGPLFLSRAGRLLTAFDMTGPQAVPARFAEILAWAFMRKPDQLGNALGWLSFSDHLHLSGRMHQLLGDILADYISENPNVGGLRESQPGQSIVVNIFPSTGTKTIERVSSLVSRVVSVLLEGDRLFYRNEQRWRAVGIMANGRTNGGALHLTDGTNTETIKLTASWYKTNWVAVIHPLGGTVGSGDITISVAGPARADADAGAAAVEVAEIVAVRDGWRTLRDLEAAKAPLQFDCIEKRPSALRAIQLASADADRIVGHLGGSTAHISTALELLPRLTRTPGSENPEVLMARTLLLLNEIPRLRALLRAASPCQEIDAMRKALGEAVDTPAGDPVQLLEAIQSLREAGQITAAIDRIADGESRFPRDIRFRACRAAIARDQGDLDLALCIWEDVRDEAPMQTPGYLAGALACIDSDLNERAAELAHQALMRFSKDEHVLRTVDRIASRLARLTDTASLLDALRQLRQAA